MSVQSHGLILSDENILSVMIHLHHELITATSLLVEMRAVYDRPVESSTWNTRDRETFSRALDAARQLIESATLDLDRIRARTSRNGHDDGRVVALSRP